MAYGMASASHDLKSNVWAKGTVIPDFDSNVWRRDKCGKAIKWSAHGDRTSAHGWEVDHIKPVALGGSDGIDNLQPLHWENNVAKGDTFPWTCP